MASIQYLSSAHTQKYYFLWLPSQVNVGLSKALQQAEHQYAHNF